MGSYLEVWSVRKVSINSDSTTNLYFVFKVSTTFDSKGFSIMSSLSILNTTLKIYDF